MENAKKIIKVVLYDIAVAAVMGGWLFLDNVYCENAFKFYCWFLFVIMFFSLWIEAKKVVKNPNIALLCWAAFYDIAIVLTLAAMGQFLYAGLQAFTYAVSSSKYQKALDAKEAAASS